MKRIWLHLAMLTLLAGAPGLAQPIIGVAGDSVHHFGSVIQGTDPSYRIHVVNRGTNVLKIYRVNPGCFCTGGVIDKETIAPGDSALMTVTFHSATLNGPVKKSLAVVSDDPNRPNMYVIYTATVVSVLRAEPIFIYRDGITPNILNEGSTSLRNTTAKKITITGLHCSNPDVRLRVGKEVLEPGDTTLLTAGLIPAQIRYYKGDIDIQTDSELQHKVRIYWAFSPVSGRKSD